MDKMEGRLRYDAESDSYVYELFCDGEWGMCMKAPCVRHEGAREGEDTAYVHYSLLTRIIGDVERGLVNIRLGC